MPRASGLPGRGRSPGDQQSPIQCPGQPRSRPFRRCEKTAPARMRGPPRLRIPGASRRRGRGSIHSRSPTGPRASPAESPGACDGRHGFQVLRATSLPGWVAGDGRGWEVARSRRWPPQPERAPPWCCAASPPTGRPAARTEPARRAMPPRSGASGGGGGPADCLREPWWEGPESRCLGAEGDKRHPRTPQEGHWPQRRRSFAPRQGPRPRCDHRPPAPGASPGRPPAGGGCDPGLETRRRRPPP